jgi:Cytochrome c552
MTPSPPFLESLLHPSRAPRPRAAGPNAMKITALVIVLGALIGLAAGARAAGATDAQLAPARDFQRKAQFYIDFVEAENSMGFHADQEATRILGEAIDFVRKGQVALRGLNTRPQAATAAVPAAG